MSLLISTDRLPTSLKPFFQEYDLTQLDVQRSSATIIERVLIFGDRDEIRWLFRAYSRQQIKTWISMWGEYALPEPHQTFWDLVLGVSEMNDES